MTEREKRQQQEIERLQRKISSLSEAYERTAQELNRLKQEQGTAGRKGRPPVDNQRKARVLALCQQGNTMRVIAEKEGIALSTVHKIIKEASVKARQVYIYADKKLPGTIIDVCSLTQKVKIVNLTDDMISRAFGIREKPDWNDFEEFMESRCMPRTRYGIREELKDMGIDAYDPFQIIDKTMGRVHGDHQYLRRMEKEWVRQYDQVMMEVRDSRNWKEKVLEFLERTEGEWRLDASRY